MKFLLDQCVYKSTLDLLRTLNLDLLTLKDLNATTAPDEKVLRFAEKTGRILLTNDLDFGQLVFYPPKNHNGVVILRIDPANEAKIHQVLKMFIKEFTGKEAQLKDAVVVVDRNKFRIRHAIK